VSNLLHNAVKFTQSGGRIHVTALRDGAAAVISVRDSGVGIPPDALPRVFEMFAEGDRSAGRMRGGLGIGLALAKRLVEMHGGSITAKSEGPAKGAEFTVRLPVREESTPSPASTTPLESTGTDAGPPSPRRRDLDPSLPQRILVVDDNRDAAESLAMLLGSFGADVRIAFDGPSALEAIRTYVPEVVLLDIGMPSMSGYEVARLVRSRPELRDVALVAVTGWSQDEDRRRVRDAGFDRHLIKPVEWGSLRPVLVAIAEERRRRGGARNDGPVPGFSKSEATEA
jgi:two-component system CheB/CheR fusion protein